MAEDFIMPKLGLTMEEGTITEWLVADGAAIAAGEPILRIETDKTEIDIEAPGAGVLHTVGQVGETYSCGQPIGLLLQPGEQPPTAPEPTGNGRLFASPNARRLASERGIDITRVRGTGPNGRIVAADLDAPLPAGPPPPPPPAGARPTPSRPSAASGSAGTVRQTVLATFAARSLADLLGVDVGDVASGGSDGRVTKDDVAAHVRSLLTGSTGAQTPAALPEQSPPSRQSLPSPQQEPSSIVPLRGMRGTIAKRMHASLQDMAQLSLFMDADLDAVVADREARKAAGSAPGYTDYVIAAAARALVEHPAVNAQVTEEGIALLPEVHVGMAVALDAGLIVPVIRNTTSLGLADLSAETGRLAEAARTGSLGLGDLEGGTFSVSTLGMFGVDGFTPVINPPNAAILGVGRLRDEVVLADDGTPGTVTRLTLSLTWDHRVLDGAPAADFTKRIVELLTDPATLDTI